MRVKPNPRQVAAVVAGIAVSFSVLYLGNLLYSRFSVGEPLDKVFKQSPAVLSYTVAKRDPVIVVRVKLAEVQDLHKEVAGLQERAETVSRGRKVSVITEDARDEILSEAYYSIHFHIQEALATGGFSRMAGEIERLAREADLERYKVFVDDDSVYVQLHLNGHYLYEVLPRPVESRDPHVGV